MFDFEFRCHWIEKKNIVETNAHTKFKGECYKFWFTVYCAEAESEREKSRKAKWNRDISTE